MKEYKVLLAYENHKVGEIIKLNTRQAKYLLLSGHVGINIKPEKIKEKK